MVLVTGASGFLGQHLVRYLSARGGIVRAVYHNTEPTAALKALKGVSWVKGDLLDIFDVETLMEGIADVYHCAAMVSFDPRQRDEMLHFNVESTTNIVNQALVQDIRKMMFVSSIAALTRSGDARKEITEEQEWGESKYNSAYGISKYLAETEVWRGIGEGLNAAIINPGIILGPGDWDKGSARLMKVANGEFPFYTNGVTSWVDVEDVVRILEQLMMSDVEGERFIVSAGNYAYKDIFTMMAQALHKKPPHIHAGPMLTGLAWRWDTFKSTIKGTTPVLTKETAANASGASVYNNEKLLKALPAFTYTPIASTIENMARYFMSSL